MNLRDFRIGWRLLLKEPAYSAVVVFGLAVGFAACFLLLGYVHHSFSYDRTVPERERVYRLMQRWNLSSLGTDWSDYTSLPARDAALRSGIPLLATAFHERSVDVRVGAQVHSANITVVDPDFQKIFQIKTLSGDLAATLARPDALALTRETATKLFGRSDVVGQSLDIDSRPYRVGAVLEDQPGATTMPFQGLAGTGTALWGKEYRDLVEVNWGSSHGKVYIKLLPGADQVALIDAVNRGLRESPMVKRQPPDQIAALNGMNLIDFKLGSIADAYLDPDLPGSSPTHGDRTTILGLAAVAVLILLLAATNYVNLATVRTLRRQREIAVRKVLGASAGAVSRQFLAESILVCLIATGIGLLLAWLLLPVFADLVQRQLDQMFSPAALAVSALMGVLLGVLAGAYPTWSALGVRPTSALAGRGNSETASGLWLRRVLTVLQFATAMGLTATTLAVAWQTRYASQLDPGFDPKPLLTFDVGSDMRNANVHAFRDALGRLPGVTGVAMSDTPVTISQNGTSLAREGGESAELSWYRVSPDFFEVYGLKPVTGRLYNAAQDKMEDTGKVVINEAAAAKLGFASAQDAVGKFVHSPGGYERTMQVLGVAPNIRHRSAHDPMQPSVYYLGNRVGSFTVKGADLQAVERAIADVWPRYFPDKVFEARRLETRFADKYADDLRLAKLLAASSVIAIAIAAFGIYVLSAYSVQRRTKEIVLRKLYGAGGGAIGMLVAGEFAALIGIGALLGLPMAWIAIERYLSSFTERAPVGLWTIVAAAAVALLVALCSTLRHTVSAMRITPVLALRD